MRSCYLATINPFGLQILPFVYLILISYWWDLILRFCFDVVKLKSEILGYLV
ncbi:hypothetical protein CFP56_017957 [Quercus suber]|uniref:Transmembrane protein n=1 Tax=Quercus suber TaxID=58331 RepID=A0AAW0KM08_QUESU